MLLYCDSAKLEEILGCTQYMSAKPNAIKKAKHFFL